MFRELDVLELIAGTTESKLARRAAKVSMSHEFNDDILYFLAHVADNRRCLWRFSEGKGTVRWIKLAWEGVYLLFVDARSLGR